MRRWHSWTDPWRRPWAGRGLLGLALLTGDAVAQQPGPPPSQVNGRIAVPGGGPSVSGNAPSQQSSRPNEHPVAPALRWAKGAVPRIEAIGDYACTFVQRERTDGTLGPYKTMRLKIRQRPFSIYAYFDAPQDIRGQEVIYVAGQNDGNLLVHGVGLKGLLGTVSLDPAGPIAMRFSKHPITEIGLLNFTHRMIRVLEEDARDPQYDVKHFPGTKIHGRSCTCLQFVHPRPGPGIPYYMARVYVDDELNLPVRSETYLWPERQGSEAVLLKDCTYLNLRLNNGFTDHDFDAQNPRYGFR